MATHIYVLGLADGKYYVGRSEVPQSRILAHFSREGGSEWTRQYKPQRVVECVEGDRFDEDKVTKQYMAEKGVENVRGGSYCQVVLSREKKSVLETELATVADRCFGCGKPGHFVAQCPQRNLKRGTAPPLPQVTETKKPKLETASCDRCGRDSHATHQCYANSSVYGSSLDSSYSDWSYSDSDDW
jgi:predicted GIY-YIG superfamily endonuclease/ribosomal protein L37E